jgi:DNA-directed RNA polymerase subunit M/transcription elongation factor TFIIS
VIIDYVNNVQRHGLPTDDHEWSLTETVTKRQQHNDDGTLSIRQCENCFRCFKTASKCPYCGYEYQVKGRELKAVKDVELKQIQAVEKEEQEKKKKADRMEQGKCKTYEELYEVAKKRGYKNPSGWAYFIMRGRR